MRRLSSATGLNVKDKKEISRSKLKKKISTEIPEFSQNLGLKD
jgi:hypothetical protein